MIVVKLNSTFKLDTISPREMSAPSHDDTTASDDAGPRVVPFRALPIGADIITIIIVIVIIIIKGCRSSRSSDL